MTAGKRIAVIAGATGAAASRLVDVLLEDPDRRVIGVSRHPPAATRERLSFVRADLLDADDTARALAGCSDATQLFYTARAPFAEGTVEDVEANVAMLRNALDGVERASGRLAHVHLVEGMKWYDSGLRIPRTPSREDDPRHLPPNFYYDQEDLLRNRQQGARWAWSASRPMFIYDFAPDRTRNVVSTLGCYAAISRELGLPLDFPGPPAAFDALTEMTDATHLARACVWMADAPGTRNQAYNVTDCDLFRWRNLWPKVARHFDMPVGEVRPMTLARTMQDKGPVWQRIVERHGLVPTALERMASWSFADFFWGLQHDIVSSTTKLRRHGFHGVVDTEEQVLDHLRRYREARLLP
ncbi:MAG: NAD(P)H-binding protein [Betaproteobacteria bacterium]|nr:NAD(P)H-binding protein [Betaproteobacteria bacterium]